MTAIATEYQYRVVVMKGNLSHEDYLNEPAHLVDWFLAIANQDAELEAEEQRRASKG